MSDSERTAADTPPPAAPSPPILGRGDSPTAADPPTVISQRMPYATPLAAQQGRGPAWALELEGQQLDHFLIDNYVGGGGMGAVFRALDLRLGRPVALKLLPPEAADDEDTLRRFEKEARSAARLDHEHIARVHYRGEDRGYRFIALEYVEGKNLRDLVADHGPLAVGESVRIVLQIADALAHVSRRGVVHRDIKPSNVIVAADGRVKLIDLGLARINQAVDDELTTTGTTLGTFDYIAPEQARDPRAADIRSDIYSLGCTWYFMLTGRPPFPEGTVLQKLLQHQGDEPPDPRQFRTDLPDGLCRVLNRMLAKDVAKRYPTAESLLDDLGRLADETGAWTQRAARRESPVRHYLARIEQHLPWLAPVVMLGLLVWVLDATTRSRTTETPDQLAQINRPSAPPETAERAAVPTPTVGSPSERNVIESALTESRSAPPVSEAPPGALTSSPFSSPPRSDAGNKSPMLTTPPTALDADDPFVAPSSGSARNPSVRDTADGAPMSVEPSAARPMAPLATDSVAGARRDFPPTRTAPPLTELSAPGDMGPMRDFAKSTPPAPMPAPTVPTPSGSDEALSGVLVVSDTPVSGARTYGSLKAAIHAARDGDIIELRYDGFHEEAPLEVARMALTIRAGQGNRPAIEFRPTQADPYAYPRRMVHVDGGRLTLIGVHLALDLPRGVTAESWSLIECQSAELLRLERCSLTIRNAADQPVAYHDDVAFFRVRHAPRRDTILMDEPNDAPALALQLQNVVARGEAVVLKSEDGAPLDFDWDNGLATVSERFAECSGSRAAPPVGDALRINLRHVTLHARRGFLWLGNTTDAPHQLPAEIHCVNSIVMVDPQSPLIEQQGIDTVRDFRERLVWTGERNFYQGFAIFWKITGLDSSEEPQQATLATWQTLNKVRENLPAWGRVRWQTGPAPSSPRHRDQPQDYALLDDPQANPARRGAADGLDAGAAVDALPTPPELSIAGRP